MSPTQRGISLALAGILILSFDSLLVRLTDTTPWDLLFWRGSMQALSLLLVLILFNREELTTRLLPPSLSTLAVGTLFTASTVCFVLSLDHTQVASTLVIVNTAPLFTAIIAFVVLKDRLPLHTIVAIGAAVGGVWLIFAYAPVPGQIEGDLYALVTAISTSVYLTIMRSTLGRNAASYLICAGVMIALFALYQGARPMDVPFAQLKYALILGGIVVPASYLCISRAPKYIPAAQTSLILLLEILLGPLLVYLFIGNEPSVNDLIGGGLVLGTLILHTLWEVRLSRRRLQAQATAPGSTD
ncbi:DMT family transporter [Shewanella sp. GXUN23E]|uniref:DMT family transporter n=1 Tax=Shewanella sp. GXUN23E TaxID=3422498 RepID=UPI003D7E4979